MREWVKGEQCYTCYKPIQQPKTGGLRKFCGNACKQKWYRRTHGWQGREARRERDAQRKAEARLAAARRELGELDWQTEFRLSRGMPMQACAVCGRPFVAGKWFGPMPRYCSTVCQSRYRARVKQTAEAIERARGWVEENQGGHIGPALRDAATLQKINFMVRDGVLPPVCPTCRLPFVAEQKTGRPRVFCSERCRKAGWERRHSRCRECGKRIAKWTRSETGKSVHRRRFCSKGCRGRYAQRAYRGREERVRVQNEAKRLMERLTEIDREMGIRRRWKWGEIEAIARRRVHRIGRRPTTK